MRGKTAPEALRGAPVAPRKRQRAKKSKCSVCKKPLLRVDGCLAKSGGMHPLCYRGVVRSQKEAGKEVNYVM